MNTEHIKMVIGEYLRIKKINYGILINGSWGSGKTFFWKNNLKSVVEENGYKSIYLSLNGISKIDILEHRLFMSLIPFIGENEDAKVKSATTLFTNVINHVSKTFLKASLTDILKGISVDTFNFSNYVICFDDLERCQIPIKEILGFINNYVEHKNLKTIILADEDNVDTNSYQAIKEKVIGRVLNFEVDIKESLPYLFSRFNEQVEFYSFLLKYQDFIGDILEEYKQKNLRITSFYLDTLRVLFPSLERVEARFIHEVILFTCIIVIEFKKGNLKSNDYHDSKGLENINEHFYIIATAHLTEKDRNNESRSKSYEEIIFETYLKKRVKDYFFYRSIYSYILSGYLERQKLEIELRDRYAEVIPDEKRVFTELLNYNFRDLSDDKFSSLYTSVIEYAKNGKYSIYDYIQIADFFFFFSDKNIISQSIQDIRNVVIQGLAIAKERKEINSHHFSNITHFGKSNPETIKIIQEVKDIQDSIEREQHIAKADILIQLIDNEDEDAITQIFKDYQISSNLFLSCNIDSMANCILNTSNKIIQLIQSELHQRYNSINIGEFLSDEIPFLSDLKIKIEEFLNKDQQMGLLKRFLLRSLLENLDNHVSHLQASRKIQP